MTQTPPDRPADKPPAGFPEPAGSDPGDRLGSTSQSHPSQDPGAEPWEGPKRDRLDR